MKPERYRPFWRLGHKWEDNIKMYLNEIRYEDMDWTHLAQYSVQWLALLTAVMNLSVP
jgi:hypothetical protein